MYALFIRHGQSLNNFHEENNIQRYDELRVNDSPLSSQGIKDVLFIKGKYNWEIS